MSRTATAAGAVAAAALLAACGGGEPAAKAAPGAPSPAQVVDVQVQAPPATGTGGVPGAASGAPGTSGGNAGAHPGTHPGTHASGAPAGGAAGASAAPTTRPSPTNITLPAKLAKECVRPGETQTVSFRARPSMKVIVNTGYADQQDGSVHGGKFTTDQRTDAAGNYTATWTVAATAPPGEAVTVAAAVDSTGTGQARLPFKVAVTC